MPGQLVLCHQDCPSRRVLLSTQRAERSGAPGLRRLPQPAPRTRGGAAIRESAKSQFPAPAVPRRGQEGLSTRPKGFRRSLLQPRLKHRLRAHPFLDLSQMVLQVHDVIFDQEPQRDRSIRPNDAPPVQRRSAHVLDHVSQMVKLRQRSRLVLAPPAFDLLDHRP